MSVSEHLRRTVALITAPGTSSEEPTRAIGSGFFVSVLESRAEPPYLTRRHEYLVTTAHLVRPERRTFVRLRRASERRTDARPDVEEIGIGRWYWPDDMSRDVAAAPLGFSVGDFDHSTIHLDPYRTGVEGEVDPGARGSTSASVGLGEPLHIISLLTAGDGSGSNGVSVVRSGTLAATWEHVPVGFPGAKSQTVLGHLVDTSNSSGAVGAPCFLFGDPPRDELPYLIQEARKLGDESLWRKALERHQETKFFGLISGPLPGGHADRAGGGSTGIGVVVPREHVVSLIHSRPFIEQRAEHMRREVEAERTGRSTGTSTDRPGVSPLPQDRSRRWR